MVNFSGPHVTLYSSVFPYLAPDAAQDLKDATVARNDSMTVSSAYRTLAQQALLYRWWRQGQCGIQVAAVPGSSNHQSGRAIDTPYYSTWKSALSAQGWTWLGSSDLVHFDHLGSPNIASKSVLAFQKLWNKNHATGKLSEDGQWGPATESAMGQSPTTGFATHGCATTGVLAGTITEQGSNTPLSGVAVKVGSTTVTTPANGSFSFTLGAGAVTITATKAGFMTNSVTRTVQVGTTVSASFALTPVVTTTTLSGTVLDGATPVSGASVSAGGQSATTTATGGFSLTLPAGTVTLTVSKAGYEVNTSSVMLVAGVPKSVQIALTSTSGDQPPVVQLETPTAAFELSRITLSGTALDDSGPVSSLKLAQNGAAPLVAQVTNGNFDVELQLTPGLNTVELTATDSAGQTTSVTWTGTFRAGFTGLVHRFDDSAVIIADAELTLLDPDTQVSVGSARSDLDGNFSIDSTQAGVKLLHVEKAGFTPRDLLIDVSPDTRTAVDVGLTPGDVIGIRFIEPTTEGPFDATELVVSGVVNGLEVAAVTVNGVEATLLGNGFVAHVPLPEGRTELVAIAEGSGGQSVSASIVVRRPMGDVKGGCSTGAGLSVFALALLLLRRRPNLSR